VAFSALDKQPVTYRFRTSSAKLVGMQSFKLVVLLTAFLSAGLPWTTSVLHQALLSLLLAA